MPYTRISMRHIVGASLVLGFCSAKAIANGPQCDLTVQSQWGTGYHASVTVSNSTDSPLSQWSVPLLLPDGHVINNLWNAHYAPDEGVASNLSWNGELAPGANAQFGFIGQHQGEFEAPECGDDDVTPEEEFNVEVTTVGRSVRVEVLTPDGNEPERDYRIEFDHIKAFQASKAWHTFLWDDEFRIRVYVPGEDMEHTETITVSAGEGTNQPPSAYLFLKSSGGNVGVYSDLSYDPDGDTLTKTLTKDITEEGENYRYNYYVLTVSDGERGDTIARGIASGEDTWYDEVPTAAFTYSLDGRALTVNGGASFNSTDLGWDFGDQSASVSAVHHTHEYEQPGQYEVTLYAYGIPHRDDLTRTINVDNGLNNPPSAGLDCWERTIDGQDYWVDCYPVGTADPDGDDLTLTWTMGDGSEYTTNSADEPVRHRYSGTGYHDVSLTVSDGTTEVEADMSINVTRSHAP